MKPCPNDARRNLLSNGQVESSRRALRLELWQFVSLTSVFLRFFLSHVRFRYCGSLKLQECAICHNNNKSACSGTPCGSSYGMFSDSISINYIKFPRLSQDTYLKKMRSAICYKMNVSRASGAACGSSYGRFCIFINFLRICLICWGFVGICLARGLAKTLILKRCAARFATK